MVLSAVIRVIWAQKSRPLSFPQFQLSWLFESSLVQSALRFLLIRRFASFFVHCNESPTVCAGKRGHKHVNAMKTQNTRCSSRGAVMWNTPQQRSPTKAQEMGAHTHSVLGDPGPGCYYWDNTSRFPFWSEFYKVKIFPQARSTAVLTIPYSTSVFCIKHLPIHGQLNRSL